jgi:hypothetical protein
LIVESLGCEKNSMMIPLFLSLLKPYEERVTNYAFCR